jgi:methionyl aminopeptidase
MPPHILHYYNRSDPKRIREGMVFTIEPMINAGVPHGRILDDHWTAVTTDGQLSAQFEHTIYVGARGAEILTDGTPRFMEQLQALGMKPSPSALP